jgi:hypothetical protein
MRPPSLVAGLALLLAFTLPAWSAPKKGGKAPPSMIDSANLPSGTYAGTLLSVPGTDGSFTLEVKAQVPTLNLRGGKGAGGNPQALLRNILQQQRRLQQALVRQMRSRGRRPGNYRGRPGQAGRYRGRGRGRSNPLQQIRRQQQAALRRLVRGQGKGGVKLTTVTYIIEFQATSDVTVRTLHPSVAFDDKGNIKTYTAEELRKLKGSNPRLPGYEAKTEDLTPGKIVQVSLATRPRPREGAKAVDTEAKKKQVRTILILAEGDGTDLLGGKKKKK